MVKSLSPKSNGAGNRSGRKTISKVGSSGARSTMACVIFHLGHYVLHLIAKPLLFGSHLTMMYKTWTQTRQAEPAAKFPSFTSELSSCPAAQYQKPMSRHRHATVFDGLMSVELCRGYRRAAVSVFIHTVPSLCLCEAYVLHFSVLCPFPGCSVTCVVEGPSSPTGASGANSSIAGG